MGHMGNDTIRDSKKTGFLKIRPSQLHRCGGLFFYIGLVLLHCFLITIVSTFSEKSQPFQEKWWKKCLLNQESVY